MTKKNPTPADFDFTDWFGDVGHPEESHDVFTRTDLVGEIGALQRQIAEEDRVNVSLERGLGDEMSPTEARLAELLQMFADSKRTFFLRGLSPEERTAIRKAHDASGRGDEDFPERCLSASIVAVQRPGGERTAIKLTLSAVQKLHRQLGDGQMANLFRTYQQVTSGVPAVDADFLLRRSGQADTAE